MYIALSNDPFFLVHRVYISLGSRYFQFVLGRVIFPRLQGKHLHLLLERQLFGHRISSPLLLLLLLFLRQSTRTRISA